ncbi:MAG: DUF4238 domain-containing protein [Acholeplasmataceae bacterium]|nr:DUF4238 domain-containing protein [Acholeplasmataceae bacterium]
MAEKENNHYVPRLILRKFDERVSIYNIESCELKLNQKLEKVFASKKLYTEEIETMFSDKVENEFARVLNNKILSAEDECILTRKEVNLIKKFLVLAMLRTMESEYFTQTKANKSRETVKINYKFVEKPEISSLSSFEYWMQTLKCILESRSPFDVQKNDNATAIAVYWSNVFMSGYIAIWDSAESNEDFVIMDQGMTSEHEKTRFLPPFNNDMIKRGYLIEKTFNSKNPTSTMETNLWLKYTQLALANDGFSENMYLFTISKNRMIAFINPFFRLYDTEDWKDYDTPEIPDIWTTSFQDIRLFQKNKNEYIDPIKSKSGIHNDEDTFIYQVHSMNLDDVIYVNCLVLDRVQKFLGFSESSGIRRSLITYSCIPRALNNYSSLLVHLTSLGYEVSKTKRTHDLATKFSINNVNFTESEKKYIKNYLELKSLSEKLKNRDN